jgi:DNA-binding MurR/RpiR family transcriptional regulator
MLRMRGARKHAFRPEGQTGTGPAPGAPTDLLTKLQAARDELGPAERRVAEMALADLPFMAEAPIAEIARRAGVSEPTIVRFCRKLGCTGLRDFKLKLARNLAVGVQYMQPDAMPDTGMAELIEHVVGVALNAIHDARQRLDPVAMEAAVAALADARQIVFYGVGGGSSAVAQDAANRFFRLKIPASAHSDSYLQRMSAATLGEGDVVFAISSSGLPPSLRQSMALANDYGATTIGLTRPGSPLARACRIVIGVEVPEHPDIFKPTASRHVHALVIDILATAVAQRRRVIVKESLRRIRSALATLLDHTGTLPVGD